MAKTAGKRRPQGTTTAMVMDALWRLHSLPGGQLVSVSRATLLNELHLPETTIDDRLRMLVKSKRVLSAGRGLYVPNPLVRLDIPAGVNGQVMTALDAAGNRVCITWL